MSISFQIRKSPDEIINPSTILIFKIDFIFRLIFVNVNSDNNEKIGYNGKR